MPNTNKAGAAMRLWREQNWPPKAFRQFQNLPIYYGSYDEVFAFQEKLAAATGLVLDHIADMGGYKPRWLRVPKVEFGVTRLNLVSTTGKASRRFDSVPKLLDKCGPFDGADVQAMTLELENMPGHVLVAHKAIQDTRVYIFTERDRAPKRERFMQDGLVLAVVEGFFIQDHSRQFRTTRKDAYSSPIAKNEEWTVYMGEATVKKKNKKRSGLLTRLKR